MNPQTSRQLLLRPVPLCAVVGAAVVVVLLAVVVVYQSTFLVQGSHLVGGGEGLNRDDIRPADVYKRIDALIEVLEYGIRILYLEAAVSGILLVMVVAQVVVKVLIFRPLVAEVRLSRQANEETLKYAEQHGLMTDSKWRRMEKALEENENVLGQVKGVLGEIVGQTAVAATAAQAARSDIQTGISEVPEKTAEKVVEKLAGNGSSSKHSLPAVRGDPESAIQ